MRLVLISDTHIPKRAKDLPTRVWEAVDAADVVFHAGDWVEPAALDALEARAHRLIAVVGNNDGPELCRRLPEVARVELDGLRFTVVHDTGPRQGREKRCDALYPGTDVLVFGHSHIPWDTTTPHGMRLLNPGSPTDRRRQSHATFMTAAIVDGNLSDVTLVKVGHPEREREGARPHQPGDGGAHAGRTRAGSGTSRSRTQRCGRA